MRLFVGTVEALWLNRVMGVGLDGLARSIA